MNEPKFTPGPLYCGTPQRMQGTIAILRDPPGTSPHRPAIGTAWDDVGNVDEWKANARLWSAAPDMYAALKAQEAVDTAIEECPECLLNGPPHGDGICPTHHAQLDETKKLRTAALAKATGTPERTGDQK